MAEERIGINFIPDDPCNGCEVEQECPFDCPTKKEYDRCMTRQEAIKRIGKAISDALKKTMDKKYVAEAALNALLKG